jgi:alpha-tubulin suppressor-like RCC1 family protein
MALVATVGCGLPVVGGRLDASSGNDLGADHPLDTFEVAAPDDAPPDVSGMDATPRCASNADCVADPAGPVCDRSVGRCSRCTGSADCMGNPAGPTCVATTGRCGPCTGAADCMDSPAGPVCDTTTGQCNRCTVDADCAAVPSRPLCNAMTGQCFRCASNADCAGRAGGTLCNTLSGACVRCTSNIDCGGNPAGPMCLMGGVCGRCAEDSDCMGNGAGPLCNRANGVCTRCTSNADCAGNPAGPQCNLLAGLCTRCASDNDCAANPAAPICNAATGACIRCTSNADCAGRADAPACNTATGLCVACLPTTDTCPAARHCDPRTFTCVEGCRDDDGCSGATPRCNVTTHTCAACVDDSHCTLGTTCRGGTCVAGCDATRPCPSGQTCCAGGCVDTSSNTANCSACGAACSVANAAPACAAGRCSVGTCNANFADCNGTAGDGCETFTGGDLANCGRCGNACPTPPNASAVCRGGVCGVGPCAGGFSDCNGAASDGCEVNLQSDARNCGACARVCPTPSNAVATCTGATCGYTCALGFADCDGDATNGCESDVRTSVSNCGTCGMRCPASANASAVCSAGACGASCNRGFANCDLGLANGCEQNTLTDVRNCGACGRVCAVGQECADGACVTPCPAGQVRCGAACVTLANDPNNCGRCGNACTATQLCGAGVCVNSCLAPQTTCGRTCTTPATDPLNCGGCGNMCSPGFGCTGGACVVRCVDMAYTPCSNVCVNLQTDEENCGGCGNRCRADQACTAGVCVTICAGRLSLCGDGECYDLANDPNNCGRCGNVCSTGCYMGMCSGVAELESMQSNNCGLYTSGRVFCWGHNNGILTTSGGSFTHRVSPVQVTDSIGRPLESVRQIATGDTRVCALLRNGTVRCWGQSYALGDVSSLASITQLSARGQNYCALRMDGSVFCWNGIPRDAAQPALTPVAGVAGAVEIAAGTNHACARLADNSVVCWGTGTSGQLGNGMTVNSTSPVTVTGLRDAAALTAGAAFTCALRMNGSVVCWGLNANGQVGNGATTNVSVPTAVTGLTGVRQVRAGLRHVCAVLTAGGVRCWGENIWSQLGDGTTTDRSTPVAVAGLAASRWVSAYDHHSCAITSDNNVSCWGYNPLGEAGGGTEARSTPARVAGLTDVVDLQSGAVSNIGTGGGTAWRCALSCAGGSNRACPSGGTVRCWSGRTTGNEYGQLGDGTNTTHTVPAPVTGLTDATRIAAMYLHACAVRTNGTVACWGYNTSGQLGDGTVTNRNTPVTVPGLSGAVEVGVGSGHSCAIVASGSERQVWCWGYNFHGELGVGNMVDSRVPQRVTGVADAADLRVLANATCVRRTAGAQAGQVWCWGRNIESQLADGSNTNRFSPGAVTTNASTVTMPIPLTTVTGIRCSYYGCWAQQSGGTWVVWGSHLGSNRAATTTAFNNVVDYDLNGSNNGSCVIRTTGVTECVGYNEFGNNGTGMLAYYDGTYRTVAGDYIVLDLPSAYAGPCAVERGGTVACWGWTGNGALLAAGLDGLTRTPALIAPP